VLGAGLAGFREGLQESVRTWRALDVTRPTEAGQHAQRQRNGRAHAHRFRDRSHVLLLRDPRVKTHRFTPPCEGSRRRGGAEAPAANASYAGLSSVDHSFSRTCGCRNLTLPGTPKMVENDFARFRAFLRRSRVISRSAYEFNASSLRA